MKVELIKEFTFEAAHVHPAGGAAAARLHGHSYRVGIGVKGPVASHSGWLIDFGDIKKIFGPLYEQLDHRFLNEIDGMTDVSMEGIASWIRDRIAPALPELDTVRVDILGECMFKPTSMEANERYGWPQRVRFGFESAHRLPNLPEAHKCRRLHGHSFHVEIGADRVEGLENHLPALYETLDHTCLNDIPGLENATSENLCAWIWRRLSPEVDDLKVIIVQETCTARCVYRGE